MLRKPVYAGPGKVPVKSNPGWGGGFLRFDQIFVPKTTLKCCVHTPLQRTCSEKDLYFGACGSPSDKLHGKADSLGQRWLGNNSPLGSLGRILFICKTISAEASLWPDVRFGCIFFENVFSSKGWQKNSPNYETLIMFGSYR